MAYPGSININNIEYNKLKFLTSGTVDSITEDNFDLTTGKPKNNLTNSGVINSFFVNVASYLQEKKNINNNFIYKYPKVLETDALRDIQILDETTIDIVFITTGASMKNMFGYYMYYVGEDGIKHLLSNSENTQGYYYNPTVIYPYVYSVQGDTTTLQVGQKRKLVGNLPNGNFANIYVGFFLIPHGWFAYQMQSDIYDHNILHSTLEFNNSYGSSDYQMVNDKIYSIYARAVDDKGNDMIFTGFEDIFVDGVDDLDYNDCVVGLIISDIANIVDYENYSSIDVDEKNDSTEDDSESKENESNGLIFIDENGEYVRFKKSLYDIKEKNSYYFERHMYFDNITDRDNTYDVCNNLLPNYKFNFSKQSENNIPKIVLKYLFRSNDIKKGSSENDTQCKIYLFESKYTEHKMDSTIDNYKKVTIKNLQNPNYYERYKLSGKDDNIDLINLTDIVDMPFKSQELKFRIIGNGVMDCINGKTHLPADVSQIYKIYKNMTGDSGLVINVKMDTHPTGYKSGSKTFLRYVSFVANTNEHIIIDLGNLNMYQENNNTISQITNPIFTHISVSNIISNASHQVKLLIDVFRNDSNASYRVVTINDIFKFYCIRFQNIKNNPTMVFLDTTLTLEWNDKYHTIGGTYYEKQRTYPISSFKEI